MVSCRGDDCKSPSLELMAGRARQPVRNVHFAPDYQLASAPERAKSASAQPLPANSARVKATTATTASHGGQLSDLELAELQGFEATDIMSLNISFGVNDFLEYFIQRLERPLTRVLHAPLDVQAEWVLTMLSDEVKARCAGHSALLQPESPAQIYQMLREAFPARYAHLCIDLEDEMMAAQESATDFLMRVQQLFAKHQVTLPSTHVDCLRVYMRASGAFVKFVFDNNRQSMQIAKQTGQDASTLQFGWTELKSLAQDFDSEMSIMAHIRKRC